MIYKLQTEVTAKNSLNMANSNEIVSNNIKDIINAFEAKSGNVNNNSDTENSKDRVKVLEKHLRKTLDNFSKKDINGSSDHSDHSSINDDNLISSNDEITTKFETYVRTVRLFADSTKKVDESHLFTCCFLVGLCEKKPYIKYKFPPKVIYLTPT